MPEVKDKKTVGILRGGSGFHHEDSLAEGQELILYISEKFPDKWKVADVFVDKNNIWHFNGLPTSPDDLADKVDVVWNTSYPSFSKLLEMFSIPVIGADSFSFALKNDRSMFLNNLKIDNLKIPQHIVLPLYQADFDGPKDRYVLKKAREVFEKFTSPWLVKSFTNDSGMKEHVANTFPELVAAIEDGVNHQKSILVEEFVSGRNAIMHTASNFHDQDVYVFPPGAGHGAFQAFGTSVQTSRGRVVDSFSSAEKEKLINLAKNIHQHLGRPYYLRSEFVINKQNKIYLINFELHPELNEYSHFSHACVFVGVKTEHLVENILDFVL